MSAETNMATVQRFGDAIEGGDLEAAARELAPRVEVDDQDIPDADGQDSFRVWLGRWSESWEEWRAEDVELIPVGDDKVLSLFRMIVKGKGSGVELARDDALLFELEGGQISRLGYYNDQDQARSAAGLAP